MLYSRSIDKDFQFPKIFNNNCFEKIILTTKKNKNIQNLM